MGFAIKVIIYRTTVIPVLKGGIVLKLTQALLPASKVQDGLDNPIASNPDEHGGYLFNTWEFSHPWKLAGVEISYNLREGSNCGEGVQCSHKFTPEECNKIVEYLKSYVPGEIRGKDVMRDPNIKGCGLLPQWHARLIELFSNTEDPPVYYWAD
jgi:hypothetical protein